MFFPVRRKSKDGCRHVFLQDVLPPLPTTAIPGELQPPNMNDYPDFKADLFCVADQLDLPVFQENAHRLHAQNLLKDLSEKL